VPDIQEIPRAGWRGFFAYLSHDHDQDLVDVEVLGVDQGAQVAGHSLYLRGISPAEDNDESLALMFDTLDGAHLTHLVSKPTHVLLQRAPDNTDELVEIQSADGATTLVRFTSQYDAHEE
jgi:hypothetical protein